MATWVIPETATPGQPNVAAKFNAHADNLNFLKTFLAKTHTGDLDNDTGTESWLRVIRAFAGEVAFETRASADAHPRFQIRSNGTLWSGDGATIPILADGYGVDDGVPLRLLISSEAGVAGLAVWNPILQNDGTNDDLLLRGINDQANPATLIIRAVNGSGSSDALRYQRATDTHPRLVLGQDGSGLPGIFAGDGVNPPDIGIVRASSSTWRATGAFAVDRGTGAATGFALRNLGETGFLVALTKGSDTAGRLVFGPGGGAAVDATIERLGVGRIGLVDDTRLSGIGGASDVLFEVAGDAAKQPQWRVLGSGNHEFGPGGITPPDVTLSRTGVGRLESSGDFRTATGMLITKSKAGAAADSDFVGVALNGGLLIDSTNSKLWARVGGVWKSVALA